MSSLNIYQPRGGVSRAIARDTQASLAVVSAQHEIADAKLMAAGSLMARGATDIINTVGLCVEGVKAVPQAGPLLDGPLRSYSVLVSDIIQRAVR